MGLKSTIQSIAVSAVKAIDDIAETFTYISTTNASAYDPARDQVYVEGTSHTGIKGAFIDFELKDIGGDVETGDQQCLIPALNLVDSNSVAVTPEIGDRIHRTAAEHWEVLNKEIDPAGALWVLHTRLVQVQTIEPATG